MHNTTLEYAYQLVVLLSTLEYSSSMQQYITLILYIILESRWCVVLYTTYVLVCILESTTSSYSRVVVISIQCLDTIVRMRYYSTSNYYCTTTLVQQSSTIRSTREYVNSSLDFFFTCGSCLVHGIAVTSIRLSPSQLIAHWNRIALIIGRWTHAY